MELGVKRAYDTAQPEDGFRVLVDRLWPRGVTKARAAIDLWAGEVAPSPELRKAWHAAPDEEFDALADRYRAELDGELAAALGDLLAAVRGKRTVTLVYALRNEEHNHAIVLKGVLEDRLGR